MKIVLYQPEIPQNTGNIVRTCAVTGAGLYLVRPFGFSLSDRKLKRAGLDYWDEVSIKMIDDLTPFLENATHRFFFFSAHAEKIYSDIAFERDDFLIFGSETKGLPQEYWDRFPDLFYTIPRRSTTRCLNLANAASIVLYESWRQQGFVTN